MTLPFSPSRAVYQGNGAATAFPFAFKVWSTDQLSVSITSPQGRTTAAQGWTASLGESGGTLTYLHNGTPLPDGWRRAIVRDMPFAQGIDLVSASRFDPQVIEDGLDQAIAELQQLNEKITRAVILPATSEQSPEDVVLSIYASRDTAEASATAASAQATAAAGSATAAASSAATAAQTMQTASAEAVAKATEQAQAAAISATAAAQSAASAEGASNGLAPRMDMAEIKITQHDTRLDTVESGVTAIATTLIGSVQSVMATDTYVPNGCVPANGSEYDRSQVPSLYDTYLAGGKLLTCTYAAWATQVGLTGNCAMFALDANTQKFKVPLLKDGDSITQAASKAELGKSVKAGLPNAKARLPWWAGGTAVADSPNTTGIAYHTPIGTGITSLYDMNGSGVTARAVEIDLKRASSVYQDGVTTVLDEQVRLRHFVVVASAQNSASVFDWANYMAALAGKANTDLSNATGNAINHYLHVFDERSTGVGGGSTTGGAWQTRNLNTIRFNRISATLDNNRITLPAGRYYMRATVPIYAVNAAKAALYNYTTATYLLYSPSYYADYNNNVHSMMTLEGEFTLSVASALELRTWVQSSYASGMGLACNISGVSEVYSEAHVWKM